MASAQIEIQSFVDKFAHLTSLGFNTNIHFNSYEGRIFVNFQADIGMFTQPPKPLAHTLLVQQHNMKPSKIRRYARREENRHIHENNESNTAVHIVPDQSDKADDDDVVLNSNQEQNVQLNSSDKLNESCEEFASSEHNYNDSAIHEVRGDDTDLVLISTASGQPSSACVSDTIGETLLPHRCCFHICEPLSRPAQDDGKCCLHRCRPTWTIHQRSKNYNEDFALLSQSNSYYSMPTVDQNRNR